jgi:hypothetical protein
MSSDFMRETLANAMAKAEAESGLDFGAANIDTSANTRKQLGAGIDATSAVFDTMEAFGVDLPEWVGPAGMAFSAMTNMGDNAAKGHDFEEASADTIGKLGADTVAGGLGVKTPTGTAINFINDTLTAVGAPEEVTDISSVVADCTPEKMVENPLRQGLRAISNIGDEEAQAKQHEELLEGDGGAPLQGLFGAYDIYERMENGEDPRDAISDVGEKMEDSAIATVYDTFLGEESTDGYQDVPEDEDFKPTSGNAVIDWMCEDLLGL